MRRLTALVIICICLPVISWGWQAVQFAGGRFVTPDPSQAATPAWIGIPGLGAEALEESLRGPAAAGLSPTLREARLTALLATHPMSAQAWLSLSGERFVLGRPGSDIDAAVAMSWVTGPNEGSLMWNRGLFELVRWQTLPAAARRQAIADLAGAMDGGTVNDAGFSLAKTILVQQSPAARAEIVTALEIAGSSQAQLRMIGAEAGSR